MSTRSLFTAAFVALLADAASVEAGPYSPDPAFGAHGYVMGPAGTWNDVLALPDGRVLAVGSLGDITAPPERIALGRFNADGTPDATFGGSGSVETVISAWASAGSVVLQGDGKIVVAGWVAFPDEDIVVLRYLDDGMLDASFGTGGVARTNLGAREFGTDLVLQPDGKIVVAGFDSDNDIRVLRYQTDGTLDASFGTGGVVTLAGPSVSVASAVALQPDGRIVVVGSEGVANPQVLLARLLANGTPDPAFGSGGIVLTDVTPDFDSASDVALLPDGRLYVSGVAGNNSPSSTWLLLRYLAGGSLDPTFGSGGIVATPMGGNAGVGGLALQADGRVVLAGQQYNGISAYRLAVIRYLSDGSIDPTLGVVTTLAGTFQFASQQFLAVRIAADGDILGAGISYTTSLTSESVLVRYGTPFPVCWDGVVDAPEQCDDRNFVDGDCCSSTCQLDAPGTACAADTDPCTADACDGAGLCTHGPGNDGATCDDGDACTTDTCQGGACVGLAEPQLHCKAPTPPSRGLFFVNTGRQKLTWNWLKGEETDFFFEQEYKLCVYDGSAAPQPVTKLQTNGFTCGAFDCWTQKGSQPIYVDNAGTHDGISRMYFTAGADGKARIQFRGRGANLPVSPLPFVPPVVVQLHGLADGQCWTASYGDPRRNETGLFRAQPD